MSVASPPLAPSVATRVLLVIFLAALVAPGVDMFLRDASARGPESEGRATRMLPPWRSDVQAVLRFPVMYEGHFNDTLGLRDHLLHCYALRCLNVFGTSPASDVRVGKDDWLFYSGEKSFESQRGLYPFTPIELAGWKIALEARRDMAASIGAAYVFVIGPNKEAIYPDYMPAGNEQVGPSRLGQLAEWMRTQSDVEFLDLRGALNAARAQDRPGSHLYFEEGTHWNGRGCMVAAQEIERIAVRHFPELAQVPTPHWTIWNDAFPESWRKKMYIDTPAHRMRDNWNALPGELPAITTYMAPDLSGWNYAIPDSELPSVLMFHDSFGPVVAWLLSQRFSTTRSRSGHLFDTRELIPDPPDLVVELFVERVLVSAQPRAMLPTPKTAVVALNAARPRTAQQRRFDASTDVRFGLSLERAPTECQTSGQLVLDVVNDAGGVGLGLERHSLLDSLIMPAFTPSAERDLLLAVEIDSPGSSSTQLFFQCQGQADWPSDQQVVIPLNAGKNRYWVPLHHSYRVARLRLRPGTVDGERCVLRRFEVRGVERP